MNQKAWIDVKSPHFSNLQPIQYIGVMESCTPPVLSPTNRQNLEAQKICDIIDPDSFVSGEDICYVFEQLTSPKSV